MKIIFLLLAQLTATALAQPGHLTDARDNQTYKTVKIGSQTWMAQNLNYNAKESVCYDNKPENCQTFGRLYNWNAAMKACPKGWHLPSDKEWAELTKTVGGEEIAGKHLKAKYGWNDYETPYHSMIQSGNGLDTYLFEALPSGASDNNGEYFTSIGKIGYWWTSTEDNADGSYYWDINNDRDKIYRYSYKKKCFFSVRCIKDN